MIVSNTTITTRFPAVLSLLLMSFLLISVIGCKSTTEPEPTGTISGTIKLVNDTGMTKDNPIDNSGVTVALYPLAVLDSTVVRLNNEHPNIGVIASQETEFDHRKSQAVYTSVTNSDGSYSLSSISPGSYNLVIKKDGYGWLYRYNIQLNSQTNDTLYVETELTSGYYESLQLKRNHHYLVNNSLTVNHLTIEPASWLRFNGNHELITIGSFTKDSANAAYVTQENAEPNGALVFNSVEQGTINGMYFNGLYQGIKLIISNFTLKNLRFSNCSMGISINESQAEIDNLTSTSAIESTIHIDAGSSNYTLTDAIFIGGNIAINSGNKSVGSVNNAYLHTNQCAYLDAYTETRLENCDMIGSDYAIKSQGSRIIQIVNNNMTATRGVYIRYPEVTVQNMINGNNINTTSLAFENSPNGHYWYQSYIMNVENNYYYTREQTEIEQKIFDLVDQPTWHLFTFDFRPFRQSLNSTAGIQ